MYVFLVTGLKTRLISHEKPDIYIYWKQDIPQAADALIFQELVQGKNRSFSANLRNKNFAPIRTLDRALVQFCQFLKRRAKPETCAAIPAKE